MDNSRNKNLEKILLESEARYNALVENQVALVCRWQPDATITYANVAFCNFHGRTGDELVGTSFLDLLPKQQHDDLLSRLEMLLSLKTPCFGETHSVSADGTVRWHRWSDTPLLDGEDRVREIQSVGLDITLLKRTQDALLESERRYNHLSRHDWLTNLPNRSLLFDRMGQALDRVRRTNLPLAVFFLDLDRFKQINDTLGNSWGDQALCEIARRLQGPLRPGDTLARLHGDEFVLVCENLVCVESFARRLLENLRDPLHLEGHTFHLSASIGIAVSRDGREDTEAFLRQADIAMFEAKRQGGDRHVIFSREMQLRLEEAFRLEHRMRDALDRREFFLRYQPQIELNTGRMTGVEALMCWGDSPENRVSPEIFIKSAEKSGLIHPLGDYALQEACAQNQRWQQLGLPPIQVTVNISAKQFGQSDFVDKVFQVLAATGLDPRWLELEITESAIMDNIAEAVDIMKRLQQAGVRFAIDDFGTGYSSLNYLRQLPLSKLKIDRSFVADVPGNRDNEKLIVSILALARSFDLMTVAEGIETEEQLDYLRGLDCRLGQGFLFSRPVAPELIPNLIGARLI
jgi:diguanylate cyclase (GGDEF)-like protein/PAS domain S-box-containing protein